MEYYKTSEARFDAVLARMSERCLRRERACSGREWTERGEARHQSAQDRYAYVAWLIDLHRERPVLREGVARA